MDVYLYLTNFGGYRASTLSYSQSAIADRFGLTPVSGSGAEVYSLYVYDRLNEIQKHNMDDVTQLEKICEKLGMGADGERMPF